MTKEKVTRTKEDDEKDFLGECWSMTEHLTGRKMVDPYVYLNAESHENKDYFKLKGTTNLRKLLESLSSIPRELHDCGAVDCNLRIRGYINIHNKPEYREYGFALFVIADGEKKNLETDYKRFCDYLLNRKAHHFSQKPLKKP